MILLSCDEFKRNSHLIFKHVIIERRKNAVWRQFLRLCGLQNELECNYQGSVVLNDLK